MTQVADHEKHNALYEWVLLKRDNDMARWKYLKSPPPPITQKRVLWTDSWGRTCFHVCETPEKAAHLIKHAWQYIDWSLRSFSSKDSMLGALFRFRDLPQW